MPHKKGLFTHEVDEKIAHILTLIISPTVASIVGIIVLYREYIHKYHGLAIPWLMTVGVIFLLTFGTLFYFYKRGQISNLDISDRRQRPKVLALFMVYVCILVAATWIMGYHEAIRILSLFTVSLAFATLITLFWKVSFHTFAVTLCVLFLLLTYSHSFLYLLFILPFVTAWTRIVLRRHTPAQAIGGIALALFTIPAWAFFSLLMELITRISS